MDRRPGAWRSSGEAARALMWAVVIGAVMWIGIAWGIMAWVRP